MIRLYICRLVRIYTMYFPIKLGKIPIINFLNLLGVFKDVTDIIVVNQTIKIKCTIKDWVQQLIYFFGSYIYESNQINFWTNTLSDDEIILDIGANVGYYSLLASIKSNSMIYSFEPNPIIFYRLEENIRLNNSKNIIALNKGVSNCSEKMRFYISDEENSGMSSLVEPENYSGRSITVDVLSIDDFIIKYNINKISKIKIDVEGNEYNVLKGMENTLLKNKPQIFIEIYDVNLNKFKHRNIDVYNYLRHIGYKSFEIGEQNELKFYDDFRDNSLAIFLLE
jgi:FkbM family methyltransferase